jgi:hypothetical protein
VEVQLKIVDDAREPDVKRQRVSQNEPSQQIFPAGEVSVQEGQQVNAPNPA